MENRSTHIEFRNIRFFSDQEDLAQECTAYMKTKQFMANRIHDQQEEIDLLKRNLIYQSGQNIQKDLIIENLREQIQLLKSSKKIEELSISSEDLAHSFVYEDGVDQLKSKITEKDIEEKFKNKKSEDLLAISELKKDFEELRISYLEKNLELNKVISEKFILFNELNELVMSLKRVDMEKLNSFYKKNTENSLLKFEMPIAKGIKFNILSAQSMICKLLKSDLISKKLNQDITEEKNQDENKVIYPRVSKMDDIIDLLKKTEEEFENLIDRKLSKKFKNTV
jgi:hypothetical protein